MPSWRTYNERRVRVYLIQKIPPILVVDHIVDHVVDHIVDHVEQTYTKSHKKIGPVTPLCPNTTYKKFG